MFLLLAGVLVVVWLVLWLGVHITGGLIHLLVVFAVISLVLHLVTGRKS